jgi:predicted restriction endonuclease
MTYRNYKDPLYIKWRKQIYARDNHTCQWPGCSNKKRLNAHHIRRWADFPGLRFDINNGITLCYLHHKFITSNEDSYIDYFSRIVFGKKRL